MASKVSAKDCEHLISVLGCTAKEELESLGLQPLTVGFANLVCGAQVYGQPLVVKRYTDLVFLRIPPEAAGAVDVYAGEIGLGPRVLYSSKQGLVMEHCPGNTLEEADMHKGDYELLDLVARALAALHQSPVPERCAGEPMLWRTIEKMMVVVAGAPQLLPPGMPSIEQLNVEIRAVRSTVEQHQPRLVLGHGDFKPSNVIRHSYGVTVIDFELGGPNYRGFDLMKVFRTSSPVSSVLCMERFLQTYAVEVGESQPDGSISAMLAEARMFEPLTWLEAAVFFLTMPQFKPEDTSKWNKLALHRWRKFMETKGILSQPDGRSVPTAEHIASN